MSLPLCLLILRQNEGEREWIASTFENVANHQLSDQQKIHIAKLLINCEAFDNFMQVRYSSVKRYGAEVRGSLAPDSSSTEYFAGI